MIDENVLKPSIRVALGLATMAAAVALGLAALTHPDESMMYFATVGIFAFVITMGLGMGWTIGPHVAIAIDATRLARARMGEDIARHEKAAAQFRHEIALIESGIPAVAADAPTPQIINNESRYSTEWDEYLLLALTYGESKGGIGWQRMKEFCGKDYGTWSECIAKPLVRAGYVNPIQRGVTTEFAPGWTFDRVRGRIEAGVGKITPPPYLPPAPYSGQPPVQQAETPLEQARTAVAG